MINAIILSAVCFQPAGTSALTVDGEIMVIAFHDCSIQQFALLSEAHGAAVAENQLHVVAECHGARIGHVAVHHIPARSECCHGVVQRDGNDILVQCAAGLDIRGGDGTVQRFAADCGSLFVRQRAAVTVHTITDLSAVGQCITFGYLHGAKC